MILLLCLLLWTTPAIAQEALQSRHPNKTEVAPLSRVSDFDFGPYMNDLQRRIRRFWVPPRGFEHKKVEVQFKIARDGSIKNLCVLKASGLAVVDAAAIKAVHDAAPFRKLPSGSPDDVDIHFTFDFEVGDFKVSPANTT